MDEKDIYLINLQTNIRKISYLPDKFTNKYKENIL